jgi:outer membrane protein assembly factor BamB
VTSRIDRLADRRRLGRRRAAVVVAAAFAVGALVLAGWSTGLLGTATTGGGTGGAAASPSPSLSASASPPVSPSPTAEEPEPINTGIEGLTTFRGNATRTYYGRGPVPKDPEVLWRFPASGALCSRSQDQQGDREWCGTGWTGQPNVVEVGGRVEVRFGAYDRAVHVLNGGTGMPVMEPFVTGDLIKGTVTSDPDGYPLLYVGSRDNYLRVLALDRGARPVELWRLSADSAPNPLWNNDWDSSPLVVDDYLMVGGENSWFYVIRLNRDYDPEGKVTVDPDIRMLVPGYDDRLLADLGDGQVSIEGSVAFDEDRGVAYFANSGGLVQGWDVSRVLRGGRKHERVFRFWTGEDTDATVVIDEEGFLYVASEQERFNARGEAVGQLMKLDPEATGDPLVWSIPVPGGGLWATPGLWGDALFAATNTGRILAVDRDTGRIGWELELPPPTWSSPVIVDDVLIVGDCTGTVHAYRLRKDPLRGPPPELWSVALGGCIESTPAVWDGMVYVGTRAGAVYGIGDPG